MGDIEKRGQPVEAARTRIVIVLVAKTPQKLGDALGDAFDRLDVGNHADFERPPQGEFERVVDLFEPPASGATQIAKAKRRATQPTGR